MEMTNRAEPYTLDLKRLAASCLPLLTPVSKQSSLQADLTTFPLPWRPQNSLKRSLPSSRLRRSTSETRRRISRRRSLITISPHLRSGSIPQSPHNHNPSFSPCLARFATRSMTTLHALLSTASPSSPTSNPSSPSTCSTSLARFGSRHCHCSAQANRSI